MRMYSPWYRDFRGAREREGGRMEGDASLSLLHVGKREITVERREECDSASVVARIEMVPRIVSLLRAQYVPSYVPPILLPLTAAACRD